MPKFTTSPLHHARVVTLMLLALFSSTVYAKIVYDNNVTLRSNCLKNAHNNIAGPTIATIDVTNYPDIIYVHEEFGKVVPYSYTYYSQIVEVFKQLYEKCVTFKQDKETAKRKVWGKQHHKPATDKKLADFSTDEIDEDLDRIMTWQNYCVSTTSHIPKEGDLKSTDQDKCDMYYVSVHSQYGITACANSPCPTPVESQ